jgi:hypothetical protein
MLFSEVAVGAFLTLALLSGELMKKTTHCRGSLGTI